MTSALMVRVAKRTTRDYVVSSFSTRAELGRLRGLTLGCDPDIRASEPSFIDSALRFRFRTVILGRVDMMYTGFEGYSS